MRGALSRPPGSGCPARSPWAERGPAGVLFFSVYFLCAPFSFLLSLTGWWPFPGGDSDVQRVYSLSMSQTELLGEKPSVDAGPRRDSKPLSRLRTRARLGSWTWAVWHCCPVVSQ